MMTRIEAETPAHIRDRLRSAAAKSGFKLESGAIRRTSSRFCFGVEHGDYNGTELFGVGTDRFIWLAYEPNGTNRVRLFSDNLPAEGLVDFGLDDVPTTVAGHEDSWARFPLGVANILQRAGFAVAHGFDGVVHSNIPGGGMSRSASLTLNLLVTMLEVNSIDVEALAAEYPLRVVELAQAVENDFIGSPCGNLDQIMIYFARRGMGTHFRPGRNELRHFALGAGAADYRIVGLDTGTDRPGLEKSTYRVRRAECEELVALASDEFQIVCLADVRTDEQFNAMKERYGVSHPHLIRRLDYIFHAQRRFDEMLSAWRRGDIEKVGQVFREDGFGLRDDYEISGPELEAMCQIARSAGSAGRENAGWR